MEKILNNLIDTIKQDQRYLDYVEADKKLHDFKVASLLHDYQTKIEEYDNLKQYEDYIDNSVIKNEIKELKKQIASNDDIIVYYQKYHCLNDFLDEITKIVFGNISKDLDISPYKL